MLLQRDWKRYLDINPFPLVFPLASMGVVLARRDRPIGSGVAARGSLQGRNLWLRGEEETDYMNNKVLSQLIFTLIFFLTDRHRATIPLFLII